MKEDRDSAAFGSCMLSKQPQTPVCAVHSPNTPADKQINHMLLLLSGDKLGFIFTSVASFVPKIVKCVCISALHWCPDKHYITIGPLTTPSHSLPVPTCTNVDIHLQKTSSRYNAFLLFLSLAATIQLTLHRQLL